MQKYIRLMLLVMLSGFNANLLSAQTTILEQSLLTQGSFNAFTTFNVTGSQSWALSTQYGANCSGYAEGQNFENEDWLVSPMMNLMQTDNVKLTFKHSRGSASVVNVGVAEGWYKVFATADYTGDPATTTWYELEGLNQTLPAAWQYVSSGELVVPDAAKSDHSRIAFRYISSATQSATWEIKYVKVTGEPQTTIPSAGVFKITNWNTEWLGCTQFGPTDESLQLNNVATAMLAMNADVYCIQEVTNSMVNPSIAALVSVMGSDEWDGSIAPSNTNDCDQRQGIIYKKSKVQLVSATQLSSGNDAQGNSYYYNWTSGRFPALYKVNLVAGNTLVPVSLINIHAKAEDNNAMSYTRRLGASEGLKAILDGAAYQSENIILIGDFNDYLIGTTSNACGCSDSPFKNFMDDQVNYYGVTQSITNALPSWSNRPVIENIIISNELSGHYILNSAAQELAVFQNTENFIDTTSDHLPVSATFQFTMLDNPEYSYTHNPWILYPNPVKEELKFDATGLENNAATAIYDLTGRAMRSEKTNSNTISVTGLPSGIYILKVGNRCGKFVKE